MRFRLMGLAQVTCPYMSQMVEVWVRPCWLASRGPVPNPRRERNPVSHTSIAWNGTGDSWVCNNNNKKTHKGCSRTGNKHWAGKCNRCPFCCISTKTSLELCASFYRAKACFKLLIKFENFVMSSLSSKVMRNYKLRKIIGRHLSQMADSVLRVVWHEFYCQHI